jgi:hypothetical protein
LIFHYIWATKNQENMDLQAIAFDLYQSNIIGGIKIKALISALSEDQKKIYAKAIEEEISKNQKQLEAALKTQQVDEVLKELRNF